MGIAGLLPFLQEIHEAAHVEAYTGRCVAVDCASWLYKGAYSCSLELVEDEDAVDAYIGFVMQRVALLRRHGVRPLLVFDGAALPGKQAEAQQRRSAKSAKRGKVEQLLASGRRDMAAEASRAGIDVSVDMRLKTAFVCRKYDIDYIIAPYEADAQLAFLYHEGIVQAVISEDSDLLVYGVRDVLFKMDAAGHGTRIRLDRLAELRITVNKKKFNLLFMDRECFRIMCILSGCDYLPAHSDGHPKGVSLKVACSYCCTHRDREKLLRVVRIKHKAPQNFDELVARAEAIFRYQVVYDPNSESQRRLETPIDTTDLNFAGALDTTHAKEKAQGSAHPTTGEPVGEFAISLATSRYLNQLFPSQNHKPNVRQRGQSGFRRAPKAAMTGSIRCSLKKLSPTKPSSHSLGQFLSQIHRSLEKTPAKANQLSKLQKARKKSVMEMLEGNKSK